MTSLVSKHRRMTIALLLGVLLAGFAAVGNNWQFANVFSDGSRGVGLVLSEITINGAARTERIDVLRVLDMDVGTPMASIDLAATKAAVEGLPWVARARVARHLPSELVIELEERQPFALWQHRGKVALIDDAGAAIRGVDLAPFGDLRLYVGRGAAERARALTAYLEAYPDIDATVRSAVRVGERRWDLIFDNGARVKLAEDGEKDKGLKASLNELARLVGEYQILKRDVNIVDLRIPGRLVLRVPGETRKHIPETIKST